MDNPGYISLTRQSGLLKEMSAIAMNIANANTTGYRREAVVFSEHVNASETGEPSISMATAGARYADLAQGALTPTKGTFDLAIEGEGFFRIETPDGDRLTRFGAFAQTPDGELATPDGQRVLDGGGAPIFIPPDAANVSFAPDGTVSVDGEPIAQIELVTADPRTLLREGATLFNPTEGFEPTLNGSIAQGFVEDSNVNPVAEISRMIEVQRAYEMGKGLMDREDDRLKKLIDTLGRSPR